MKTTNKEEVGLRLVYVGLPAYTALACVRVEMILACVPAVTVILGLSLCLLKDS